MVLSLENKIRSDKCSKTTIGAPPSNHLFICIEGVDGVGKTVVGELLARRLNGKYYKTPPPPYDSIRRLIDHNAAPLARFLFYLSSVAFASREIESLVQKSPVVCDRYIWSTLAYHVEMDPNMPFLEVPSSILKPHYAFLLVADEGVRNERIQRRSNCAAPFHDEVLEADQSLLNRVEKRLASYGLQRVDTAYDTPEATVDRILSIIDSGK